MLLTLLSQIATFGLLTLGVMALNGVVFAWLGGGWGVLVGLAYQALFIFHIDLQVVPGPLNTHFAVIWFMHLMMVNLLLLPAWVLGLLLRRLHLERIQRQQAR